MLKSLILIKPKWKFLLSLEGEEIGFSQIASSSLKHKFCDMKRVILLFIINLLITEIGFAQWQPILNGVYGGSVKSIAKDPNTNFLYTGTVGGGIFVSADNGNTWNAKNNGLLDWRVACIKINNYGVFAGTDKEGIFLSTDNGNSWIPKNNGLLNLSIISIAFYGNAVFVGTAGGIFRSTNNGSDWVMVSSVFAWEILGTGGKIYVAAASGVYMSNDLGNTWTLLSKVGARGAVFSIAVNGSSIYVGSYEGVYLSTDNGASWGPLFYRWYNPRVKSILTEGNTIYAGTPYDGLYRSTDNGNSWVRTTLDKPIEELLSSDGYIFAATYDGIYSSTDYGNNWTPKNNGLSIPRIGSLAVDKENIYISAYSSCEIYREISESSYRAGVADDNKFYKSFDKGVSWWSPTIDLKNVSSIALKDNEIFVGTSDNGICLSTDNGNSWTAKNNGLDNTNVRTITISGSEVFAGTGGGIFLSADNGNSWTAKNNGIAPEDPEALFVHATEVIDNRIYASFSFGTYLSIDNGSTWTAINSGFPVRSGGTINTYYYTPDCFIENTGFVFGGTNGRGIYKFSEGERVWHSVTGGLPENLSVYSFASYGNNVFAGTSEGLFLSIDSCNAWTNITDGYIYPMVTEIALTGTEIIIGTSGAGLWKRLISDLFYLNTSTNAMTVDEAANSTGTFNLTSLNTYWKIACSDSWLTVSTSTGTGNTTITVPVQENTSTTPRTAILTISGTSVETKTVTVTQEGVPLHLNTSVTSLPLGSAEGASGTFDITSNTAWTVSSSETWLTIANANGSANGTVTVTAQKNPTINTRNATITVKTTGLPDKTVTVTQVGAPTGIMDSDDRQIKIYPNPANTILVIDGLIQEVQMSIYDIQGRLVLKKELMGNVIDISSLASGVYSIVLESNNEIIKRKFVKE